MNVNRFTALLLMMGLAGSGWAQVARSLSDREPFVPGEVLVRFKDGADGTLRARALAGLGEARARPGMGFLKVKLAPGLTVQEAVARLKGQDPVESVQPNYRYYALGTCAVPTDLYDLGYATNASWPFLKVQMDKAVTLFGGWTSCSPPWGPAGVTVAILDSGVSRNHPDLLANGNVPYIGYNAVCATQSQDPSCGSCGGGVTETAGNAYADDDFGHGTYVAGLIGGHWNLGSPTTELACAGPVSLTTGVAGVAPGAVLMPVKVLDCTGSGTTESIAAGTRFAVDHGARVLNFSLGSSGAGGLDPLEKDALDYAIAHDCVIVASSGNESFGGELAAVDYPAAYPPVLAVGATDQNDQLAFYSNGGENLDLVAPGGSGANFSGNALVDSTNKVLSAFLCPLSPAANSEGGFEALTSDNDFGVAAGTSAAAPFVSGAAALLFSLNPSFTHSQVEQAILNNTDSLDGGQGWNARTGYGRLNIYRALVNAGGTGQVVQFLKTFNSPNPFYTTTHGTTNITLAITQAAPVELTILDTAGETVYRHDFAASELDQNPSNPQFQSFYIPWDGKDGTGRVVNTGIYFYSVKVNGQVGYNKIALIRGSK